MGFWCGARSLPKGSDLEYSKGEPANSYRRIWSGFCARRSAKRRKVLSSEGDSNVSASSSSLLLDGRLSMSILEVDERFGVGVSSVSSSASR